MQWDLSFCNPCMERRFSERFARRLVLVDSAHCALLLLMALYGLAQAVLPGSHHAQTAPMLASGVPQYPFRVQPRMWVFMSCMSHDQECHFGPLVYLNSAPAPSSATRLISVSLQALWRSWRQCSWWPCSHSRQAGSTGISWHLRSGSSCPRSRCFTACLR